MEGRRMCIYHEEPEGVEVGEMRESYQSWHMSSTLPVVQKRVHEHHELT